MRHRKSSNSSRRSRLQRKVFEATGSPLSTLLKIGAVLVVAVVGIAWTLLYTGAEQDGETSNAGDVASNRLTDEEKFREMASMPENFLEMQPVEKLGILNSKIETGENLAKEGSYADQASKKLVLLYGERCLLEESEGIDSDKTYRKLAELHQKALAAGNGKRVASIDFCRALLVITRLKHRSEPTDFRFASNTISNLDSSKLVRFEDAQNLFANAIALQKTSSSQDDTASLLALLADKLVGSPESEISELGLTMKDFPKYFRFSKAAKELSRSTPESKREFYNELFTEVQKSPPQSSTTYQLIIELLDKLVNKSDHQTASLLTSRLSKAVAMATPEIKAQIGKSIESIETRIAVIGKMIDLSGTTFDGAPLQIANGKPTTLLFWRPDVAQSWAQIELLSESALFDPWETNVLIACPSPLSEEQLEIAGKQMLQFKVLDNATSLRLAIEFGIDLIPYQVSLDKDGTVIRLGEPAN